MGTDFSRILYDKYFSLKNRSIEIKLKKNRIIKGKIISFYKGDEEKNEPYIIRWHIINEDENNELGIDYLGFAKGEVIKQEDIISVMFFEDNSVLIFKQ